MSTKLTKSIKFGHKNGMHIRPAQLIKQIAEIVSSDVQMILKKQQAVVNLKKDGLLDIMILGIVKDDEIDIVVEGDDGEEILDIFVHIFTRDILHKDNNHDEEINIIKNKNWNEKVKSLIIDTIMKNK